MGKVALILLLVVALFFWLRMKLNAKSGAPAPPPAPPKYGEETMVACAQCGVHLPASEAVLGRSARPYCGVAHRAKALDGPPV
jgi:uncharacterized protein